MRRRVAPLLRATGDLTPEQWAEIVPEQDYISVCPSG